MNRLFKIAVVSLLTLAGLLIVAFVLLRCVFKDEATAMLLDRQKKERVELLRSAAAYAAEPGADYRFTYRQDTARAREISRYFRLDTLLQADAPTWERALTLARFVARNIPHANQHGAMPSGCGSIRARWSPPSTAASTPSCSTS